MQVKTESLKALLSQIVDNYKTLDTELTAYRMAIRALEKESETDLQYLVAQARESPALRKQMDVDYEAVRQKFLSLVDRGLLDQEIAELLKSWKPTGLPS